MQRDELDAGLQDLVCELERLCGCGRREHVRRQFVATRDALLTCAIPIDAQWLTDGLGRVAATFGLVAPFPSVDAHPAH